MDYNPEVVLVSEELQDASGRMLAYSKQEKTVIGEVEIIHQSKATGKTVFTRTIRRNDLLATGSVYMSEKLNGFRSKFITTPIDVELGIHSQAEVDTSSVTVPMEVVCGIMVGNGGSSDTYNTVARVRRASRTVPGVVPFRVVPATADLSPTVRSNYILRKPRGEYIYYYGKRFDADPFISVLYEDGTVVPTNVGDALDNSKFIKVYTTYRATVDQNDIREYFKITQGSTLRSLVNSVGLITGYPGTSADGNPEFYNVRGMTTLNMENQELKDSESTITYIYRVFIQ